jgi:antitoxin ParD1/3/4
MSMEQTEKISITIRAELLQVIRDIVAAGEYPSTSEAVHDAIRVWQRQRSEDAERLNAVRDRIRRSLEDPRPDMSLDEVDAHLDALSRGKGRYDGPLPWLML